MPSPFLAPVWKEQQPLQERCERSLCCHTQAPGSCAAVCSSCPPSANSYLPGICLTVEGLLQHMLGTSGHRKLKWWRCFHPSFPYQAEWFLNWGHECVACTLWNSIYTSRQEVKFMSLRTGEQMALWFWFFSSETIWLILCGLCVCVLAERETQPLSLSRLCLQSQGKNLLLWKWILPIPTFTDREEVPVWLKLLIPANVVWHNNASTKLWPFLIFPQNQSPLWQFSHIHLIDHKLGDLTQFITKVEKECSTLWPASFPVPP